MLRVLLAAFGLVLLSGCQGIVQDAYDERAEDECEELRNIEEQRACLNAVEDRERDRRQRELSERRS